MAIPIVNQAGMRDSIRKNGPDNQTDVIWENLVDARTVELTANDNTIYNFIWADTHKGPLVVEVPPMVLGLFNDFWYRWVADVGITGEDHGKGGKYLCSRPATKVKFPKAICREAQHLRQLACVPRVRGGRLHQARRRIGEEKSQDL